MFIPFSMCFFFPPYRTWFERPLKSREDIECRHAAIAYLINPRNLELVNSLEESIKHIKNISVSFLLQ